MCKSRMSCEPRAAWGPIRVPLACGLGPDGIHLTEMEPEPGSCPRGARARGAFPSDPRPFPVLLWTVTRRARQTLRPGHPMSVAVLRAQVVPPLPELGSVALSWPLRRPWPCRVCLACPWLPLPRPGHHSGSGHCMTSGPPAVCPRPSEPLTHAPRPLCMALPSAPPTQVAPGPAATCLVLAPAWMAPPCCPASRSCTL